MKLIATQYLPRRGFRRFLPGCAALFLTAALTGCGPGGITEIDPDEEYVQVSKYLTVENEITDFTLTDNKDALAAKGLYYATWVTGDAEEYENSDGDTVSLYDAQIYLLLSESKTSDEAQENLTSWIALEKSNNEVVKEDEITRGGQTYTLITYDCSEDNPYAHGAAAFTVFEGNTVSVELTCRDTYDKDPEPILLDFLDHCRYNSTD